MEGVSRRAAQDEADAQGSRLRVAAADIAGVIPLMVVSDYLTDIAEVTLQQVQRSAWRDMFAKYGRPGTLQDMDTGFAIIGYGKLGGRELGYGSGRSSSLGLGKAVVDPDRDAT